MMRNKLGLHITLVFFLALTLPWLVRDGMFIDGILYAAISHNMAQGYGSFLHPIISPVDNISFFSHPPMALYLESISFKIFGSSFISERVYCFGMLILNAIAILLLWKENNMPQRHSFYWLPLLTWISIPLVSWSFCNNILEITLGVFTTFAAYFIWVSCTKSKPLFLIPAAACIMAGLFTKGFPALFPLIIPTFFVLFHTQDKRKQNALYQVLLVCLFSVGLYGLYQIEEVKHYMHQYFIIQVSPSLENKSTVVAANDRMHIVMDLISDLLILILLAFLFKWYFRKKEMDLNRNKSFMFIHLFIGLSASLPIMLTLKQRKYYLLPCLAYFALFFAEWFIPYLLTLQQKISANLKTKLIRICQLSFVGILILSIFLYGSPSRDQKILKDIKSLAAIVPPKSVVSCTEAVYYNYAFQNYGLRYNLITMNTERTQPFFLTQLDYQIGPGDSNYIPLKDTFQQCRVFKRIY